MRSGLHSELPGRVASRSAPTRAAAGPSHPLLGLQRTIGNRAVARLAAGGPPARAMLQRMAACPSHLNDSDPVPPGWKPYFGSTSVFHCGFRVILENRAPTPGDPMNECVYDHDGVLVDGSHRYSGCRGTPDEYDSRTDPVKHAVIDKGGIVRAGLPAAAESAAHAVLDPLERWFGGLERDIRRLYGAP